MTLPNYFIADLPPGATLSPVMIREACQTLKRNRLAYLAERSTPRLIRALSELAEDWLQPDFPFRQLALELGPAATGFPVKTLANGLDSFFRRLTAENLRALLVQDLGHAQRLDAVSATGAEVESQRAALATGPEMLVHIAAGNVPNPTLMSILLGLLTHSAQFVKCATGTSLLPRLFAHSLYQVEPKLASCLEIAEWRGGNAMLEEALFAEADCVTVTGSDATIEEVRDHLPPRVRLLSYGHRVSFGYVTRDVLFGSNTRKVVAQAAADIIAWNQLGCLSPQVIYVENGGSVMPVQFATLLADELARRELDEPRGPVPTEVSVSIAARRNFYEVRAAGSEDTRLWCSPDSTAWTVVFETDPLFAVSCLHRFVFVKAASDLTEVLHAADAMRGCVSTVGLAALEDKAPPLATQLARWGVTRVCPLGQMQQPPLAWRHDGRPSLADLVTWTDWEQ
ncbi:MAG: hypothetical protein HZA90_13695 [Verrucomicrobia bacterium]|nr:hypothetical protein [Verrucomicrobiota bacterium]